MLRPHLDSLRSMQRSGSEVCMGASGKGGGMFALFVIPDLRHHRRYCQMAERTAA